MRLRAITLAMLSLTLSVGGCSSGDDDPGDPAVALSELQSAFAAKDLPAVCERLTGPARKQAGSVAHGTPSNCPADLRRAFKLIEEGGGWDARPTIVNVTRDGDRATALIALRDRSRAEVPLAVEDGRWKLASFFGTESPAEFDAYDAATRNRPFPSAAAGGRPVTIAAADGGSCGELSDAQYPSISGGCEITVTSGNLPLRMSTPFGAFTFGRCSFQYQVSMDGNGRTWTRNWDADSTADTPCSDVDPCDVDQRSKPWKGRLTSDGNGGFLHRVDMCMRTCIGLFSGEFVTRFVRYRGGWRVLPTRQGTTGFQVEGPMRVTNGGSDFRPS